MDYWRYLVLLGFVGGFHTGSAQEDRASRLPEIPATITSAADSAEWIVEHYWDLFDFEDTTLLEDPQRMDWILYDYLGSLRNLPDKRRGEALLSTLERTEQLPGLTSLAGEILESLLYDMGSPMRDEELYISLLTYLSDSPALDETAKIRPRLLLELALRNRTGSPATDFAYQTSNGTKETLYETKAEWLLLLFYDPDCIDCAETIRRMKASPVINDRISRGELRLLALYPDRDTEAWGRYQANIPTSWINAYDPEGLIRDNEMYDLQASPTIYLLDREKTVRLKNATFSQIERYLELLP